MPFAFALTLLLAPLPTVEEVISWLPTNTETLLVARKPGQMSEVGGNDPMPKEVRYLLTVGLPGRDSGKAKIAYDFVVDGSRKFRPPKSLGIWLYQGCKIIGLQPAEHARLRKLYTKNARSLKIGNQEVFQLSQKLEQDTWTYQIAFLDGIMLCATDRGYLTEVLNRRKGPKTTRALPETLPQWKYIDKQAPLWAVRNFTPEANKAGGGANMGDSKLIGYAMP